MPLQPGDQFGPYEIRALLGAGGMGEVYRAHDPRLARDVALKVIAAKRLGDPSMRRRFEIEARAASALNHPSIVTIYDVGNSGGVSWIAMEWIEGRSLREALSDGLLSLHETLSIARQLADGLAAAHAKGVVHRDLKPENIMLAGEGRAKILDFGLARQSVISTPDGPTLRIEPPVTPAAAATLEGTILGTVGYMSPEQASGRQVDARSDQFAFGLILYEILAGRRAFQERSAVETLAAIIRDEPPPLASLRKDIPRQLQQLVTRCIAKLPQDRFESTRELANLLDGIVLGGSEDIAASAPTEVRAAPPSVTPLVSSSRRTIPSILAVLALALPICVLAWLHFQRSSGTIDSLAILPFQNATGDPEAEYLSDGLTESLIDQMSGVPALKVAARTTVSRFKGATDPQAAGQQLRVGAVLMGTISRRGDQLIISSELVEISTGARLWGQTYDRPAADLLRVQDSIAWEIVDGLRLRLSVEEKRTLVVHATENPDAYALFLKARYLLQHDNEDDDLEARRLFLQALEKAPKFTDAYLGVAGTYARSAGSYASPREAWSRADEYRRKALALDPGNFGARVSLAIRHFHFDWDWRLAETEFRELSTDARLFASNGYQAVAMFYWATGRPEQSISVMERGLRVDPLNVQSRLMMADFLAKAGRIGDSIAAYVALNESEPGDPRPLFSLAELMRRRGETQAAIDMLRKAYELADEKLGVESLAAASTEKDYDLAQMAVARAQLAVLEDLAGERYVSPLDLGRMQARVGNRDKAFAMLALALAERSPGLSYLKVDRAWDPIRHDARFAAVVDAVGIP